VNWNVRQGAAGEAQVPLSVPLPETKVTGEAVSAGEAPSKVLGEAKAAANEIDASIPIPQYFGFCAKW
jgi:hypothetical protein